MRLRLLGLASFCLVISPGWAQTPASSQPQLDQFAVGVNSFIDIGPPFDFYEVYLVQATDAGTLIQKVNVTPAGDVCTQPPKVEFASRRSNRSIAELMGGVDPCAIPEKKLHKEIKRCKKCLVFSGMNLKLQVQCASGTRIIKSDILDRDIFDPHPTTPVYTSWTQGLLGRLGEGFGPGVWDKPIFQTADTAQTASVKPNANISADFRAGRYDVLFDQSSEKLSDLYRSAEDSPQYAGPIVRLLSSIPSLPVYDPMPTYPAIARAAHLSIHGEVTVSLVVGPNGEAEDIAFSDGPPFLRTTSIEAISHWKYALTLSGQRIEVKLNFDLNCIAKKQ